MALETIRNQIIQLLKEFEEQVEMMPGQLFVVGHLHQK